VRPDRPFSFTEALASEGSPEVRLSELLRGAKAWVEATNLELLLDALLVDRPSCRDLFDRNDKIDHIGFLLPMWAKALVSHSANAAGFALGHRAFPSALVARELGRLTNRRRLETQIFKAHCRSLTGSSFAFEAFIPATDDAQVEAWIRSGVGNHVAVAISDPARFREIRGALLASGLPMSGFMYNRAVYLHGEDATILYFDLDRSEHPFRLEIRAQGDHVESGDS
jgi:hypothetical protein